jgi:hypothetical protein
MGRQVSKSRRKANPLLTKNGRTRIKPMSLSKLQQTLESTSRPRDKDKLVRRIKQLEKRA